MLSSPVWLYQIWAFVAPGLHAREKRWSYPTGSGDTITLEQFRRC